VRLTCILLPLLTIIEFVDTNPELISSDNAINFISDDGGVTYNSCHCKHIFSLSAIITDYPNIVWSNFEIGNLDFWRSDAYSKFFDFLDEKGGFYYEVYNSASQGTRYKLTDSLAMGGCTHPYDRSSLICAQRSDCVYAIPSIRPITYFYSISSMILATDIPVFSTAHKVTFTRRANVGVIRTIISVSYSAIQKAMFLSHCL